jgi:hypothetical protein
MATQAPVKHDGWPKGMDNRRKDFELGEGVLRDGLNVDVLNSGKVRRRSGPGTQAFAESGAHSVHADGTALLWGTSSTLRRGAPGTNAATLLTDPHLAKPLSWLTLHGKTYFSNEDVNGSVNVLGAYEPWGIVPPAAPPVASSTTSTVGVDRLVQVTCTFLFRTVALDGTTVLEESGAPLPTQVHTDDTAALSLFNIPQSSDARFAGVRLYLSALDGSMLFREVDLPPGITFWSVKAPFGKGQPLEVLLNSNPPPGQLIEHHHGSIFIASGNTLYETVPLRYGQVDNDKRFFMFSERITMVLSVPQGESRVERPGVFISADHTYFLEEAGTAEAQLRRVFDYKAIEGAAMHLPDSKEVMWLSERGVVKGFSGGRAQNMTEGQIAMDDFTRAAMGLLERNGHRSVMVVGQSSTPTTLLSTDWVADEAAREVE